jgi:hypothetical protein
VSGGGPACADEDRIATVQECSHIGETLRFEQSTELGHRQTIAFADIHSTKQNNEAWQLCGLTVIALAALQAVLRNGR